MHLIPRRLPLVSIGQKSHVVKSNLHKKNQNGPFSGTFFYTKIISSNLVSALRWFSESVLDMFERNFRIDINAAEIWFFKNRECSCWQNDQKFSKCPKMAFAIPYISVNSKPIITIFADVVEHVMTSSSRFSSLKKNHVTTEIWGKKRSKWPFLTNFWRAFSHRKTKCNVLIFLHVKLHLLDVSLKA